MNSTPTRTDVKIWQQNLGKSLIAQQEMLATAHPTDWDVLAIQEPYIDNLGNTRANPKWSVIYPTSTNREAQHPPRTVILVNTRIPSETITQIDIESGDITAITINTSQRPLTIINIYNANEHNNTIETLSEKWERQEGAFKPGPNTEILLLGDFNRHHPAWEPTDNAHLTSPDRLLNPLLDLIVNMRLEMTLPRDLPTLEARNGGRWTRPDNVWRNTDSASSVIICNTREGPRPTNTDHLPIVTTLDLIYTPATTQERFNFRLVDWEKYEEALEEELAASDTIGTPNIDSIQMLENTTNELFRILGDVTERIVPKVKPYPHLKRWWSRQLTALCKDKNRASAERHRWRGTPDHPSHTTYRDKCKNLARAIETAKATHWKEWIEQISGHDLWTVNKYMGALPTDFGCKRIPHLNRPNDTKTKTSEEKAERLAQVFFPEPKEPPNLTPQFDERDPPRAPPTQFSVFTNERVEATLRKVSPFKAPGQSGIPNAALRHCAKQLAPILAKIYTAICRLDYYPTKLRNIDQIVIRKPGRPSYEEANAYRPIALIETIAKIQTTIVAEDLSHLCEKYNLLPNHQFGGRPGRTTSEALHLTEQFIRDAWRKGDVVSALFLDIQAAFPNMQRERLLTNMRARNINEGFCKFTDLILTHRQIRLKFDDVTSQPINPPGGCNQGCPLSMLLYIIYNAPLINIARTDSRSECIIGFVDDTTLLARGSSFDEAHSTLKNMMERRNGVFDWSRSHSSPLEMNKLALVNFSHSLTRQARASELILLQQTQDGPVPHPVKASTQAKLLGVILDTRLNWKAQQEKVREKAVKFTTAFRRFTRPSSGIRPTEAAKLYNAVIVPRICYASDVWYTPPSKGTRGGRRQGSIHFTNRIESIQRQAAIAITGAMRTVAGDAAIVHANIKPIALQLRENGLKSYARILTRPASHPLHHATVKTARRPVKNHRTALHRLAADSAVVPTNIEKILTANVGPNERSPYEVRIADDKDEAIRWDEEIANEGTMIYTDGSCFKGMVGAAAVLYTNGTKQESLGYQLGTGHLHTVFEGELTGIILGLHLVNNYPEIHLPINFSADNQAALKAIRNRHSQPGQHLVDEIHRLLEILRTRIADEQRNHLGRFTRDNPDNPVKPEENITFTWVAGHSGSTGNEEADKVAKEAAEYESDHRDRLPPYLHQTLPASVSAICQMINNETKQRTTTWWKQSPRFKKLKAIDPSLPSKKFTEITSTLTHRQTSTLTQLRTDHAPFFAHLHRIGCADTPTCPQDSCNHAIEDLHHFFFICPAYTIPRYQLIRDLGRNKFSLPRLLADPKLIPLTIAYINSTNRFKHILGNLGA